MVLSVKYSVADVEEQQRLHERSIKMITYSPQGIKNLIEDWLCKLFYQPPVAYDSCRIRNLLADKALPPFSKMFPRYKKIFKVTAHTQFMKYPWEISQGFNKFT